MAIRWFRKNNKKILALATAFLAVAFLLPSFSGRGRGGFRDRGGQLVGVYFDEQGNRREITTGMIQKVNRQLKALESIGLSYLLQINVMQPEAFVYMYPEMGLFQLLFAEGRDSHVLRNMLYEQAMQSGLAQTPQQMESLLDDINQLTGSEPADAGLLFLLLSDEARRAGYQIPEKQIDDLLQHCQQLAAQGIRVLPPAQAAQQYGLSEQDIRSALADCLAVIVYTRVHTSDLTVSEPQLKKSLLDQITPDSLEGTFVAFSSFLFQDQVPQPTLDQLQLQFDTHKKFSPEQPAPENPFGFGYRLENRVQIEYLRVNLKPALEASYIAFAKLSPAQRDQQLQKFWSEHPSLFTRKITVKDEKGEEKSQSQLIPFDDAVPEVQMKFLARQTLDQAQQIMVQAKNKADASAPDPASPDLRADYAHLAREFSQVPFSVEYNKSQFLSYRDAQGLNTLRQTYQVHDQNKQRGLINILFQCEPLFQGPKTRLETTPVRLFENIGPLLEYDLGGNNPAAVLLVRIIGVDPEREPASLVDDGTDGPLITETRDLEKSRLYQQVKRDWRNDQAFQIARQYARQFAEQARTGGWETALDQMNQKLQKNPPDQPTPDTADSAPKPDAPKPLQEETIAQLRKTVDDLRKMAQENVGDYFQQQILRNLRTIQKAAPLAYGPEKTDPFPLLEQPEQLRCLVFQKMHFALPDENTYLKQRPFLAHSIQMLAHQRLTLCYLNPENIKRRNGFERHAAAEEK